MVFSPVLFVQMDPELPDPLAEVAGGCSGAAGMVSIEDLWTESRYPLELRNASPRKVRLAFEPELSEGI